MREPHLLTAASSPRRLLGLLVVSLVTRGAGQIISASRANPFSHCSYHGQLNVTDHTCTCVSGYVGPDCSQRLCPVGYAWADYATADGAHARWTECSNMGYCDRTTGSCECRAGFEGAGCQYLSCPTGATNGKICSGNGKCLSMRQAARNWNGRNLIRPGVTYANWDADQVQGCVCDEGWTGHDCSQKECPRGDDPLTGSQRNEVMQIACRASGGNWFFTFKGVTSKPIPYNAGFGTVERILEEMSTIIDVAVTYSHAELESEGGDSPACQAAEENIISLEFMQQFGELPAARVDGSLLTGTTTIGAQISMISSYWIECSPGARWGSVFLTYDDSISSKIPYDASVTEVKNAIEAISGIVQHNPYGNVTVTVEMSRTKLCTFGETSWTNITLKSIYGNLMMFGAINGLKNREFNPPVNFTIRSLKGTKENELCSNHGICDRVTGSCQCSQQLIEGTTQYLFRYSSSDGYGNKGRRGDCGHAHVFEERETMRKCPMDNENTPCSGRGVCNNDTFTCDCYDGFFGPACQSRSCPNGSAWFDEATMKNRAHAPMECSGRGSCDYTNGICHCDPLFGGSACEKLYCEADTLTGEECNGHGRCMPMWRLAEQSRTNNGDVANYAYGTADLELNPLGAWDRSMIHGCHCDTRNDYEPYTGPKTFVSGWEVDNPKIGGWTGWDCSARWCPTGDDPMTHGDYEVQTIACKDGAKNLTMTFRGETTRGLRGDMSNESDVKEALEALNSIGEVSVEFPRNYGIACHSDYGDPYYFLGIKVTFLTELGDLPMMSARQINGDSIAVNETKKGTKENAECSNRGYCDYSTGQCQCLPGFSSSAGNDTTGIRRDCGHRNLFGYTLNPYYGT